MFTEQEIDRLSKEINSDETLEISKKKIIKDPTPSFDAIGDNPDVRSRVQPYPNLYQVLRVMSSAATNMFWALVDNRNRFNNECYYKCVDAAEQRLFVRGYKELNQLNLIKRIKRQQYMINPLAIFPMAGQMTECRKTYNSLK